MDIVIDMYTMTGDMDTEGKPLLMISSNTRIRVRSKTSNTKKDVT